MSPLIDIFQQLYDTNHWALYNGNNWTPYLCAPALYWAVAFHHHDARTTAVMRQALDVMWLHRAMWLPDGVYKEGVKQYSFMAIEASTEILRLVQTGLGATLPQLRWDHIGKLHEYHLASMASDGRYVLSGLH